MDRPFLGDVTPMRAEWYVGATAVFGLAFAALCLLGGLWLIVAAIT